MNYRNLLVHLDTDDRCDARVALTGKLAEDHEAHVMGVAVGHRAGASALADAFQQRMRAFGVASFDVRVDEGDPLDVLARHACSCDLAVLGQPGPSGTVPADFAQRFFLRAGRPALIVPEQGELTVTDSHVLVAWNGSRESTRAIADALPWLRKARQVGVLCLERPGEASFSRLELNDLRDWLKRHGVTAQVTQTPARESVAHELMNWVRHTGCDVLVMGGYGHARTNEIVFGGVTRSLLARMPVPLLISH